MLSMMDRGPQRTEFSRAQNKGGGGIEAKLTWPGCQGREDPFLGNLFSAFCSSVYIKNRTFSDFQVLFLTFWNALFKLESPELPPTTQQFQAMWPQPTEL